VEPQSGANGCSGESREQESQREQGCSVRVGFQGSQAWDGHVQKQCKGALPSITGRQVCYITNLSDHSSAVPTRTLTSCYAVPALTPASQK
jgi:hypothetical protein